MLSIGQRAPIIATLAVACAATFFWLGAHPLIDPDEPRYAESAREMIQRHDLLVPYLNGEPRLGKPPVFYWLDVVAMKCLGVNEFAARLPSALAGIATACLAAAFAAGLYGVRAGYLVLPVFLSMPLVAGISRISTTDMTMTAFLSAALVLWWNARSKSVSPRLMAAAWAALALAVLTKGPVALALFVLTIFAFCALRREWKLLAASFQPVPVAIFLIVALPWPVAVMLARPDAVSIWYRETFERFAGGVDHGGSFLLPLGVVFAGTLPWCLVAAPPERRGMVPRLRGLIARDDALFLTVWVFVVVVFFTLCRTRMPHYVLPAAFPVAVMAARRLDSALSGTGSVTAALMRVSIGAGCLVLAAVIYAAILTRIQWWQAVASGAATLTAFLFLWVLVRRARCEAAVTVLVCSICLGTALLTPHIMKEVSATRSMASLAEHWRGDLRNADAVYFSGNLSSRMSLVYYLNRKLGQLGAQGDYEAVFASPLRTAVIELGDVHVVPPTPGGAGSPAPARKARYDIGNKAYFLTTNYVPGRLPD